MTGNSLQWAFNGFFLGLFFMNLIYLLGSKSHGCNENCQKETPQRP